jgi:glycine/D-amino acid oxidase-like deaminating enzyme
VRLHTSSPVQGWSVRDGVHHLRTPGGTVRARRVAVCTGGYTGQALHPLLKNRLMPILSNSVVTRVLTEAERTACNLRSQTFMTDTRTLRFYYRLLKDHRLQIGSRSSVTGAEAADPAHEKLLTDAIARKFPPLAGIANDHSWWGWVDVSHDMMPRIFQPDPKERIFYAMGYGGNGVMYSAQAGRRMAQLVAGKGGGLDLPIFASELPGHGLLTPFRRIGQRAMYRWYFLRDETN